MMPTDFPRLKQLLADRSGLDLDLLERPAVDGFVRRRCLELGLSAEADYYELAAREPLELERLVHEVAVAETWFFRYPASFQLVVDHAAELLRQGRDTLSLLSIACATGEEPYSLAMAAAAAGWPMDRVQVDAVDRQDGSLTIARRACYRKNSFREVIPNWAQRWFHPAQDGTRVDARIVAAVTFSCRDILSAPLPPSQGRYDIVFCRNLFIYFSGDARAKLAERLSTLLAPDGILFVGHAEYAILPIEVFESAGIKHAFAFRLKPSGSIAPSPSIVKQPIVRQPIVKQEPIEKTATARRGLSTTPHSAKPFRAPRAAQEPDEEVTLDKVRKMADAGQVERAISALEGMQSPRPEVFELLGSIQLSLGRLELARDAFKNVLYFNPHHETALLQMAIICERLGDAAQSARFRRRAARAHQNETQS